MKRMAGPATTKSRTRLREYFPASFTYLLRTSSTIRPRAPTLAVAPKDGQSAICPQICPPSPWFNFAHDRPDSAPDFAILDTTNAVGLNPSFDPSNRNEFVVRVTTLGRFVLEVRGQVVQFGRKAPTRLLDLLNALIAAGPNGLRRSKLVVQLWPDAEEDAGQETLRKSLQRLRRLLVQPQTIRVIRGALSLDPKLCWIDAWVFDNAGELLTTALLTGASPDWISAEEAVELYQGPFLIDEEERDWIESTRDRLRGRYISMVRCLSEQWRTAGKIQKGIACLEKALEAEPLAEALYRSLMSQLHAAGEHGEAKKTFDRCRKNLARLTRSEPSPETIRLFKEISV